MSTNLQFERLALIACLAEKSPSGSIGRTALMKFCYFLQTLRHVPLGYRFTLYSYGPFDSDVLADLDSAEAFGAVKSQLMYYPGGYGYLISPSGRSENTKRRGVTFLHEHMADIEWVMARFGNLGAADLELASTTIYVDREAACSSGQIALDELVRRVHDVKPHFPEVQVRRQAESLRDMGLLQTLGLASAAT